MVQSTYVNLSLCLCEFFFQILFFPAQVIAGPSFPADSLCAILDIEPPAGDKWAGLDMVPSNLETAIPALLANELTENRLEITPVVAGRGRGLKTAVPLREGQFICNGTGIKFSSKNKLLQFLKIPGHAVYNDRVIVVEDVLRFGVGLLFFPSPQKWLQFFFDVAVTKMPILSKNPCLRVNNRARFWQNICVCMQVLYLSVNLPGTKTRTAIACPEICSSP